VFSSVSNPSVTVSHAVCAAACMRLLITLCVVALFKMNFLRSIGSYITGSSSSSNDSQNHGSATASMQTQEGASAVSAVSTSTDMETGSEASSLTRRRVASRQTGNNKGTKPASAPEYSQDDSEQRVGDGDSQPQRKSVDRSHLKRKASETVSTLVELQKKPAWSRAVYKLTATMPAVNLCRWVQDQGLDLRIDKPVYDQSRIKMVRHESTSAATASDSKAYVTRLWKDRYAPCDGECRNSA
jgi:hypothetical protein